MWEESCTTHDRSSSVPSLDDVFARLLRISSTQTLPSDSTSDSSVLVSQTTSRADVTQSTRALWITPSKKSCHTTYPSKISPYPITNPKTSSTLKDIPPTPNCLPHSQFITLPHSSRVPNPSSSPKRDMK